MDSATQSADSLGKQIAATGQKLKRLKAQLASVEAHDGTNGVEKSLQSLEVDDAGPVTQGKWPLSAEEYKRYGRQMIVPSIGIQGTLITPSILDYFAD
jgi:adenylyltransferase/sulfurtransferase